MALLQPAVADWRDENGVSLLHAGDVYALQLRILASNLTRYRSPAAWHDVGRHLLVCITWLARIV